MNSPEWYLPARSTSWRPVRVWFRCEYAPHTAANTLTFIVPRSFGSTPEQVDAEILRLLVTQEEFELPAVGEKRPMPFLSETVRAFAVW